MFVLTAQAQIITVTCGDKNSDVKVSQLQTRITNHKDNESTKVQTLGVFLGIDRSMSWKQRCLSYVSM